MLFFSVFPPLNTEALGFHRDGSRAYPSARIHVRKKRMAIKLSKRRPIASVREAAHSERDCNLTMVRMVTESAEAGRLLTKGITVPQAQPALQSCGHRRAVCKPASPKPTQTGSCTGMHELTQMPWGESGSRALELAQLPCEQTRAHRTSATVTARNGAREDAACVPLLKSCAAQAQ
jgi:hypothetical protein